MSEETKALAFHEPGIVTTLSQAAFLLLLNVVNSLLDRWIHCGLIGQIFLGTVWGVSLANWLSTTAQDTIVELGYLGLILMVYEGGLTTNLAMLRRNLGTSAGVALTGIALPIALSFLLMPLLGASPLQAFAAGASLCSTSLGTTFTIFASTGLSQTRDGVITIAAAMLDDVVGLVMVQVIENLGGGGKLSIITILRPIIASLAAVVVLLLVTLLIEHSLPSRSMPGKISSSVTVVSHMLLLFGFVAGISYAGASSLLAAYLAGVTINWWHLKSEDAGRGLQIWEMYLEGPVNRLLKPLFFASIGFAIPIKQLFSAKAVWCGVVYAILMGLAKFTCGIWVFPFKSSQTKLQETPDSVAFETAASRDEPGAPNNESHFSASPFRRVIFRLFSPALVGSAMVARGEIGFLIASIAQSNGIFTDASGNNLLFLVVIWAIVLCTVAGPIFVGILAKNKDRIFKYDKGAVS